MTLRSTLGWTIAIAAALAGRPTMAADGTKCAAHRFAIVIHGGVISRSVTEEAERLAMMKQLLGSARALLKGGASALDTVESLVRQMEDTGIFNAGKGAISNAAGFVETDASIMDGNGLKSGAVASMIGLKNPVSAARLVMEKSPHVLMVGDRGEAFVRSLGAEAAPPEYFLKNRKGGAAPHGTVGAVALDRCGHIAAATSTGGFDAKVPGRVGDSPIVGAGVYADDAVAGFSATGHGEIFIRYSLAKDVADRMRYGGLSIDDALKAGVNDRLSPMNETGALIGLDRAGHVATAWNGVGLFRGFATDEEAPVVAVREGPTASKPRSAP
jgi:beta-aspartyl-peptidase (threonine type)